MIVHTDDGGLAVVIGGVGHRGGGVLRIHSDVAWVQVCFNLSNWVVGDLLKGMAEKDLGRGVFLWLGVKVCSELSTSAARKVVDWLRWVVE